MSNAISVTITKHVYIDKWALNRVHKGGALEANDFSVYDRDNMSSDYNFHLCPLEVTIEVPSQEAAQLMELAGCENALVEERNRSLARMKALADRIDELKALPAPAAMEVVQ